MQITQSKIGIYCRVLWTGGVARVAIREQEVLASSGVKSELIFVRNSGSVYSIPKDVKLLNSESTNNGQVNSFRKVLWSITKLFAGHRGESATVDVDYILQSIPLLLSYDVVLFHDQWAAIPGLILRLKGKKYILFLHEFFRPPPDMSKYSPLKIMAWLYDIFSLILAPEVVTISSYNYNIIKKFKRNVHLIRNGCPTPITENEIKKKYETEQLKVIALSLWEKGRHPDFYAKLAIAMPSTKFTIAGSWVSYKEQNEYMKKFAHVSNLSVSGKISEQEKDKLLNESHIYVRIGYNERGPGMGGLEAMSKGCIPLANTGLGLSEIIKNDHDGFVIKEPVFENTIKVVTMIKNLPRDKIITIALNSIENCKNLSWENHTKSILKIIENLH